MKLSGRIVLLWCTIMLLMSPQAFGMQQRAREAWKEKERERARVQGFIDFCAHGSPEEIRAKIQAGVNVNDYVYDSYALIKAAEANTPEAVKVLLEAGARLHEIDKWGYSAFMLAARRNSPEMITTLLDAGVNVNETDRHNNSALMGAAGENTAEAVRVLLEADADVNHRGNFKSTALIWAVNSKNTAEIPKIVRLLLMAGADPSLRNLDKQTPLMIAESRGDIPETVELLKAGSENLPKLQIKRMNPDRFAALCENCSVWEIVKAHDSGINFNAQGKGGMTGLMSAAEKNTPAVVKALLKFGADPNIEGANHKSALYAATMRNDLEIMKVLISYGADVNQHLGYGIRLLMIVAEKCEPETIELLLNSGAEPKLRNNKGRKVIDFAINNRKLRDTEIFKRLEAESR